jgi:hypothetical protein
MLLFVSGRTKIARRPRSDKNKSGKTRRAALPSRLPIEVWQLREAKSRLRIRLIDPSCYMGSKARIGGRLPLKRSTSTVVS